MSELIANCPFCHTPPAAGRKEMPGGFYIPRVWCVGHPPCPIAGITFSLDDWRKLCRNMAASKPVEKAPELPVCRLCGSQPIVVATTGSVTCECKTCDLGEVYLTRTDWIALHSPSTIPPKLAEALRNWRSIWPSPIEMAPSIHSRALVAAIDAEPLLNQGKEP